MTIEKDIRLLQEVLRKRTNLYGDKPICPLRESWEHICEAARNWELVLAMPSFTALHRLSKVSSVLHADWGAKPCGTTELIGAASPEEAFRAAGVE